MALITLNNAYLAFGSGALLDHTELNLHQGERIALVGRNGTGKSTLLNVLYGELSLDDGQVLKQPDLKIARLEQDPPSNHNVTVFDFVAQGLSQVGDLLSEYHHLLDCLATNDNPLLLNKLTEVQEQIDHFNGWQYEQKITSILADLHLDGDKSLDDLSGGWQRKAALARALVIDPDLLLLDEPTNHLDVETIIWLETFLKQFNGCILFISHDRRFIQKLATRIIDLDRGILRSYPGDYATYLITKEDQLRIEVDQSAEFDKKLAKEEVWIRQGIKARRTRNEGRVRALEALRKQRSERREQQGNVTMQQQQSITSGKIIFEADHIGFSFVKDNIKENNEEICLFKDFSFRMIRGDRIAFIGANGSGKSTMLKVLIGELQIQYGQLHCGTKLEVAYFDQYRETLDPEKSIIDNLADGKQEVMVAGKMRHALGYLQDFLFHPQRAQSPVKSLSGGEKNRLLLAKLLLKPCNLLILDEPTNDLDIETLDLLEEWLSNYDGTLLLVSHDRAFIDNVATHCWYFDGKGHIKSFVGSYSETSEQYQKSLMSSQLATKITIKNKEQKTINSSPILLDNEITVVQKEGVKLTYKEKLELEQLPKTIEQLEQELNMLQEQINQVDFFQKTPEETKDILTLLATKEEQLEQSFNRWVTLDMNNK